MINAQHFDATARPRVDRRDNGTRHIVRRAQRKRALDLQNLGARALASLRERVPNRRIDNIEADALVAGRERDRVKHAVHRSSRIRDEDHVFGARTHKGSERRKRGLQ